MATGNRPDAGQALDMLDSAQELSELAQSKGRLSRRQVFKTALQRYVPAEIRQIGQLAKVVDAQRPKEGIDE